MLVAFTRFPNISAPCGIIIEVRPEGFTVSTYRVFPPEGDFGGAEPVDGGILDPELKGVRVTIAQPQSFDWLSLIALNQGHDHACIVFPLILRHMGALSDGMAFFWQAGQPYNRTKETMVARRGPWEHSARTQEHTLMHFYVPWAGAAPEDCALHLILQDGFLPLVRGAEAIEQPIDTTIQAMMPTLVLPSRIGVPKDGYAEIPLQTMTGGKPLSSRSVTAYLEATGGYLPRQRVEIKDGSTTVRIGALGLDVGDSFRVKAGWRYFPGVADVTCEVV